MSPERKLVESMLDPLYRLGMNPHQSFVVLITRIFFLVNSALRIIFFCLAVYMIATNLDDVDLFIDGLETIVVLFEVGFNLVPLLFFKLRLRQLLVDLDKFWQAENSNWDIAVKYLNFYKKAFWFTFGVICASSVITTKPLLKFYIPDFEHAELTLNLLVFITACMDYTIIIATDCYLYASCYVVEKQFCFLQDKLAKINIRPGVQSELGQWTIQHDFLLRYTLSLAKIFEIKFFMKYILYIGIFCAEAYVLSITSDVIRFFETVSKIAHLGLQMTLICSLTARVSNAAEMVSEVAYSLEWYNWPVNLRKDLILIIQRSQNVPRFTALGVIPIDHTTLTAIFQKAYSFYTIAKNMVALEHKEFI